MIRPAILAAVALGMTGCATGDRTAILHNLEGCQRSYIGTVQGGVLGSGFTGSVNIDCKPQTAVPLVL